MRPEMPLGPDRSKAESKAASISDSAPENNESDARPSPAARAAGGGRGRSKATAAVLERREAKKRVLLRWGPGGPRTGG